MSLNASYSFREGWIGLRRARLASVVTISTVALTLFLLSSMLLMTINIHRIIDTFKKKMSIEIFMDSSQTAAQIMELENRLLRTPGVQEAVFISKEKALEKFREEFGEDPLALLGENPLPPSFQITLKPQYRTPARAEEAVHWISQLEGVDEVVYHGRLFKTVDRWSRTILLVDFCLLLLVLVSTLLLVANTLRLTLLVQSKNIKIMRLVGATQWFIRMPYIIQGVIEGGLGGTLSALILWIVLKGVLLRFPVVLHGVLTVLGMPILLGVFLGFFGSLIGLKRFLRT